MHSSPLESVQNGRYQYVRLLGQGNIGSVYLMQDMYLNRKVAVKVMQIKPDRYPEKDAILHIQRSARVITSLEHPNILSLYDFGEEQDQQGNILTYNVMLFCPEGSLADWLHQRGRSKFVAPQDVVYFITQAADALQYTHDHGVLHLNVKPSNFLVRGNARDPEHPYLQLSDFGAIQSGTPANLMLPEISIAMAPEQWNSKPVPATDQYALAVITYQLLAGCFPYRNTVEQGMPPPPSNFNPHLSHSIERVLLQALAKQPEERFPSVSAFADALNQAVRFNNLAVSIASSADIRATLAITQQEALSGTSRILTLPGERQVRVTIPEGAYDGQVIRLTGSGDMSENKNRRGDLILTLAISRAEQQNLQAETEIIVPTELASFPGQQNRSASSLFPPTEIPPLPQTEPVTPSLSPELTESAERFSHPLSSGNALPGPYPQKKKQKLSTFTTVMIVVVATIIFASLGAFFLANVGHSGTGNSTNGTTNSHTSTSASSPMSTSETTPANNPPNPYPPGGGILALNDTLSNNANGWNIGANGSGGDCEFTSGGLQVSEADSGTLMLCMLESSDFTDFAFEVQMTVNQGDAGGLIFRADISSGQSYALFVSQNGGYTLDVYGSNDETLTSGTSPSINQELNQTNTIAVVAQGSTITLYANQHQLTQLQDSTYSEGQIGLLASAYGDNNAPNVVMYSNVKVWTF